MRFATVAFFALLTCAAASSAENAAWPTQSVRIIVGYPPGASPDTLARLVADPLSRVLGKPVVVENKPGAAGNLAGC